MIYPEFQQRYQYNTSTDRLGGGGFGDVFKAYDTHRDRWIAIKIAKVLPGFESIRLKKEVEMVGELPSHPNIAYYEECYTYSSFDGEYDFGILQYYEEGNLLDLLKKGNLPQEQKYNILTQILSGLNFLHTNGIIHRDLKPQNILIVKRGNDYIPKITDFGISKKLDVNKSSVFSNSIAGAGTLAYSSPEQLGDCTIRKNTDLWSFGVIAYQVLTGELPFNTGVHGNTSEAGRQELFSQINSGKLPEKLNMVEEPWQELIRGCLVSGGDERVKGCGECREIVKGEEDETITHETLLTEKFDDKTIIDPIHRKEQENNKNGTETEIQEKTKPLFDIAIEKRENKRDIWLAILFSLLILLGKACDLGYILNQIPDYIYFLGTLGIILGTAALTFLYYRKKRQKIILYTDTPKKKNEKIIWPVVKVTLLVIFSVYSMIILISWSPIFSLISIVVITTIYLVYFRKTRKIVGIISAIAVFTIICSFIIHYTFTEAHINRHINRHADSHSMNNRIEQLIANNSVYWIDINKYPVLHLYKDCGEMQMESTYTNHAAIKEGNVFQAFDDAFKLFSYSDLHLCQKCETRVEKEKQENNNQEPIPRTYDNKGKNEVSVSGLISKKQITDSDADFMYMYWAFEDKGKNPVAKSEITAEKFNILLPPMPQQYLEFPSNFLLIRNEVETNNNNVRIGMPSFFLYSSISSEVYAGDLFPQDTGCTGYYVYADGDVDITGDSNRGVKLYLHLKKGWNSVVEIYEDDVRKMIVQKIPYQWRWAS